MAQKYFGDLATLSKTETFLGIVLGVVLLILLGFLSRSFTSQSFARSIEGHGSPRSWLGLTLFDVVTLFSLCFCVQTVGYLFAIACVFIPTALASRSLTAGLYRHLWFCALVAAVAPASGFIISLSSSKLPTVPTIIVTLLLLSWMTARILSKSALGSGSQSKS